MGEHAVVQGTHAICSAVSQRLSVRLSPLPDRKVRISSALGQYEEDLDTLPIREPFTFVVQALRLQKPTQGIQLDIESEFSSQWGFGSSAAVTVATVTVLRAFQQLPFDRAAIFDTALQAVRNVQGQASGADVAAATYGGAVLYRANPLSIEPIVCDLPLAAVYAGYKTPTPDVLRMVDAQRQQVPDVFASIDAAIDRCVLEAVPAIRNGDMERLGRLFRIHRGLQQALGTEDATLCHLLQELEVQPGVHGAKISGSGLGDCVIALGNPEAGVEGYDRQPVKIDSRGVSWTQNPA